MKTIITEVDLPLASRIALDQAANIIASTTIVPRAPGTRPFRYVVRHLPENDRTPYVTHMETDPYQPGNGYHCGRYCETIAEAIESLRSRSKRENVELLDENHEPLK